MTGNSTQQPCFPQALEDKTCLFQGNHTWDQVSQSNIYYQTIEDEDILSKYSEERIREMPERFSMVELGTGAFEKIAILLDKVRAQKKYCFCLVVDISRKALKQQVDKLSARYKSYAGIQVRGYQEDLCSAHLRLEEIPGILYVISLGSVLLNDEFPEDRLRPYAHLLQRRPGSVLHISQDASTTMNSAEIMRPYGQMVYLEFIRRAISEFDGFSPDEWDLDHLMVYEPLLHHAFRLKGKGAQAGKEYLFFRSYKITKDMVEEMTSNQGLFILKAYESSRMSEPSSRNYP
ncbi:unnamed protein product [Clonostachys solani]|uniref:Histidine-specific methyltransferase SAM-dependent domain-containing protein n=1 Tax=Clonostachys solani TaxID=160281 RepID=A0A9P0EBE0_9HYPO|nr:unnamed protein product [Clonostachys solani]